MATSGKEKTVQSYNKMVMKFKFVSTAAMIIGIFAIVISSAALYYSLNNKTATKTTLTTTINSSNQPGSTLANINQQLNSSELAVINNAQDSYFEKAGQMYLNNTLVNLVAFNLQGFSVNNVSVLSANNKPSVIYFGSTTCIFCAENRWAMALALSRFGKFSALYKGYSALKDADAPTLYWTKADINGTSVGLGSYYTSSKINFISIEDTNPITGGFSLHPISFISQAVNSSNNSTLISAFSKILKLNNFQGTPYTIWGAYQFGGADAVVFGNSSATSASGLPQLSLMDHKGVLNLLSNPTSQFAISEYAAADIYVASACAAINDTATTCKLPSIQKIEAQIKSKAVTIKNG